jgi:uncharacterized protein YccT (UPF0319 family)
VLKNQPFEPVGDQYQKLIYETDTSTGWRLKGWGVAFKMVRPECLVGRIGLDLLLLRKNCMRSFRLISLVLFVFGLVACSGKPVKTYEGEALSESEVAILIAGDNIEIKQVNGKPVPEYLLKNLETKYALKPGKNSVVFIYTSVWATAGQNDDARSELIESGPQYLEFDAKPGAVYTFEFDEAGDRREARAMASDFTANLVTVSGGLVTTSAGYVPVEPEVDASGTEVLGNVRQLDCAPAETSLSGVEGMKALWKSASQQERKEFLQWAFQ